MPVFAKTASYSSTLCDGGGMSLKQKALARLATPKVEDIMLYNHRWCVTMLCACWEALLCDIAGCRACVFVVSILAAMHVAFKPVDGKFQ